MVLTVNYLIRRMNRELSRAKFRAIGSAALILLAVTSYVSFSSMTPSAAKSLEDMVEEQNISDLIVHVGSADLGDVEAAGAVDGVGTVDHRVSVSSRLRFEGPDGEESVPATLVGIEPDRLPLVNTLRLRDGDGSFFSDAPAGEALVEGGFALGNGISPEDTVELQTPGGYATFSVQGLVFSPEHILIPMNPQSVIPVMGSLAVIYLPIDDLRAAFGFSEGYVNEVLFLFDGTVPAEEVSESVSELLAPNIVTFSQAKEELYGYALVKEDISQGESFSGVIAFLILLVAFFVIYSFFSRIVDEQRKQIGVLRALGYSRGAVLVSYLYMALVVGFSGSLLGIVAGVPFGRYFADYYVETMMYSKASEFIMSSDVVLAGLLFGPVTAALACAVAVWSTVSLEPHEAIKDMRTQRTGRSWLRRKLGHRAPRSSYITVYTLRNLFRHRRRTFFTVVAVAFSIVFAAMSFLMIASFSNSVEKSVTDYEHWDMVVDYSYPLNSSSVGAVSVDGMTDTVQVARLVATWSAGGEPGQVIVTALPMDQTMHGFQLIEGEVASSADEAMVSYAMSKDSGISVGDQLVLDAGSGAAELTVSAIHADSIGAVIIYMEAAESLVPEPALVGMFVTCEDGAVDAVASELGLLGVVANVQLKSDIQNGLLDFMTSANSLLYAFSMVGVTISTLTVANVVFMGVLERQREYGQLRAIGYSRRDMSRSIVTEIMVVIGIASVAAAPLLLLMLESFVGAFREFWPMYETILYAADWIEYFVVLGMVVAFGLLAAVPAIRYVNRMDIAKAVTGGRFG